MRERDGKERKSYISREIRSREREEEIEKLKKLRKKNSV